MTLAAIPIGRPGTSGRPEQQLSPMSRGNTVDVRGQRGMQDGQAGHGAARDQGRWW